jgi:hypothetical protein
MPLTGKETIELELEANVCELLGMIAARLSNENILECVDMMLAVMDDDDLFREWFTKRSY